MRLTVEALIEDQGTVVVLSGRDDTGRLFHFGAEHRAAQVIVDALSEGVNIGVEVDSWQILAHVPEVQTVEQRLAVAQAAVIESEVADWRDELGRLPTADREAPK